MRGAHEGTPPCTLPLSRKKERERETTCSSLEFPAADENMPLQPRRWLSIAASKHQRPGASGQGGVPSAEATPPCPLPSEFAINKTVTASCLALTCTVFRSEVFEALKVFSSRSTAVPTVYGQAGRESGRESERARERERERERHALGSTRRPPGTPTAGRMPGLRQRRTTSVHMFSPDTSHTQRLKIPTPAAAERRGNDLKGFVDFHPKARTRIWSWLSYMCRVRSTAVIDSGLGYHKSRRCSMDTYPESYIAKYTSIRRLLACRPQGCSA